MKQTKLKIENFVGNKLENLVAIKGGEVGPVVVQSTGGGSATNGNGGGLGSDYSFPIIPKPKPITLELIEIEEIP